MLLILIRLSAMFLISTSTCSQNINKFSHTNLKQFIMTGFSTLHHLLGQSESYPLLSSSVNKLTPIISSLMKVTKKNLKIQWNKEDYTLASVGSWTISASRSWINKLTLWTFTRSSGRLWASDSHNRINGVCQHMPGAHQCNESLAHI